MSAQPTRPPSTAKSPDRGTARYPGFASRPRAQADLKNMLNALQGWKNRFLAGRGDAAGDEAQKQLPRTDPRFDAPGVACPLGTLVDLSASGARLVCDDMPVLKKGDIEKLGFTNGQQRLSVDAEVVWIRSPEKTENNKWEVGVEFQDQRPGVRGAIEELAQTGRITGSHTTHRDVGAFQPARVDHAPRRERPDPVAEQVRDIEDGVDLDPTDVAVEVVDLYAVLGVEREADHKAIRSAYHEIAKRVHPDRGPSQADEGRFIAANKAYRVLSDEELRDRYDTLLVDAEARAVKAADDERHAA